MKNYIKILCTMLCCILTLALAACGNTETRGNETQPPVNSETNNNSEEASGASTASFQDGAALKS